MSLHWEKRVEEDGIQVADSSTDYDLIRLHLQVVDDYPPPPLLLSDMLQDWSQEDGQRRALLRQPGLCALHIARGINDGSHIYKSQQVVQFLLGAEIPSFFAPGSLDIDWTDSSVVAATAHLGEHPLSGHYRTALRAQTDDLDIPASGDGHVQWFLTEDNEKPTAVPKLPHWFMANVTILWLCADNMVDFPRSITCRLPHNAEGGELELPPIPSSWNLA